MRTQHDCNIISFRPPNAEVEDDNHPALVAAIVSLFDLLAAAKKLQHDHGSACRCGPCTDLRGMVYNIEMYLAALQAHATRSPTIARREQAFQAR